MVKKEPCKLIRLKAGIRTSGGHCTPTTSHALLFMSGFSRRLLNAQTSLRLSFLMVPSNRAHFDGTAYSGARVLVNDDGRSSSVTGAAREDPSVDDRKHSSVQSSGSTRRESNVGGLKLARVSQTRIYYPGQSYETDDLAPRERFEVDAHTPTQKTRRAPVKGKEIDKHLLAALDFRNARLLSQFVSETGKILPRRKSGLSAKVHRKMVRDVKTSRMMGIIPFTERLPQVGRKKR